MIEDPRANNEPSKPAQNCGLDVCPTSSSPKTTGLARHDGARRQKLQTVVIPRCRASAKGKKGRISEPATDAVRKEAKNPDLSETNVRPPASGVKRQANIIIEVPPLPVDWWTREEKEIHSPSMDDGPSSTPVVKGVMSPKPQNNQPKKRARGRPREETSSRSTLPLDQRPLFEPDTIPPIREH